jgi:hypothetical protein
VSTAPLLEGTHSSRKSSLEGRTHASIGNVIRRRLQGRNYGCIAKELGIVHRTGAWTTGTEGPCDFYNLIAMPGSAYLNTDHHGHFLLLQLLRRRKTCAVEW